MDVRLINSTTSTDASEEVQEWTITNKYILFVIDHLMLLIEVAGFVGVVLVFMIARYLATVEKKIGKKAPLYLSSMAIIRGNIFGLLLTLQQLKLDKVFKAEIVLNSLVP